MKEYKITIDFGKGPFEQYIVLQDDEQAQAFCDSLADCLSTSFVFFKEVTGNG